MSEIACVPLVSYDPVFPSLNMYCPDRLVELAPLPPKLLRLRATEADLHVWPGPPGIALRLPEALPPVVWIPPHTVGEIVEEHPDRPDRDRELLAYPDLAVCIGLEPDFSVLPEGVVAAVRPHGGRVLAECARQPASGDRPAQARVSFTEEDRSPIEISFATPDGEPWPEREIVRQVVYNIVDGSPEEGWLLVWPD